MTSTPDRCMGCGDVDARTMLGAILCQDCEEIVEPSRHAMSLITEVTDQPR